MLEVIRPALNPFVDVGVGVGDGPLEVGGRGLDLLAAGERHRRAGEPLERGAGALVAVQRVAARAGVLAVELLPGLPEAALPDPPPHAAAASGSAHSAAAARLRVTGISAGSLRGR